MAVMALDFVQLEFFMYGLVGLVYTHDFWVPAGISFALWAGIVWTSIHRFDFDEQQFDFHVYSQIALWLGVAVGYAFVLIFRTPRMFNVQPFENIEVRGRAGSPIKTRRTPEGWLFWVTILLVTLGVYYVSGDFVRREEGPDPPCPPVGDVCDPFIEEPSEPEGTGVSQSTSNAVGGTLIAVFGAAFIALFLWSLIRNDSRTRARRLLVKYMLLVAVKLSTAAIYDFTMDVAFVGFNTFILSLSLIVISVLEYFYIAYVAWWVDGHGWLYDRRLYLGKRSESDPSPDFFQTRPQVLFFVIMFGTVHLLSMAIAGGIDAIACNNVIDVMITFGALSVFWIVMFLVVQFWLMRGMDLFDGPDLEMVTELGVRRRRRRPAKRVNSSGVVDSANVADALITGT